MKSIILVLTLIFLFGSCKNNKDGYEAQENNGEQVAAEHPGKKLMETHCYVCHAPDKPGQQGRIAPPMAMVQNHYIKENTSKEEFEKDFMAFLKSHPRILPKCREPFAILD